MSGTLSPGGTYTETSGASSYVSCPENTDSLPVRLSVNNGNGGTVGGTRTKTRRLHVEVRFFWTPSKTSETHTSCTCSLFKKPKHLLSFLPRQGHKERPPLTGQSHKLQSAVGASSTNRPRSTPNSTSSSNTPVSC
jgi:hypothetical protein